MVKVILFLTIVVAYIILFYEILNYRRIKNTIKLDL